MHEAWTELLFPEGLGWTTPSLPFSTGATYQRAVQAAMGSLMRDQKSGANIHIFPRSILKLPSASAIFAVFMAGR